MDNVPCPFNIKLTGPAFIENNQRIDLLDFANTLLEFHKALDKTYCILTNQQRISPSNRKQYQLITKSITKGSLLLDNEIIFNSAQLVLPIVGIINPQTIWEYTSAGFKFLKTVYELFSKEKKAPQYVINNPVNCNFITGDNNLINSTDNIVTVGDPRILDIAAKSRPHYGAITKSLNANNIEGFQAGFKRDTTSEIALDFNDRGMFKQRSIVDKNPLQFHAKIIDFNTEKRTGKLKIFDLATSSFSHDYNFSIIGDQDIIPYIEALKHPMVSITALSENILDPVHGLRPLKYQLIDIEQKMVS
ncbi:hypothetical protein SOV_22470 [Sporomusa ovata DSM 2662]|uniref:hypothetical protein n=1 Tax=Sporomusa ovata TaxID=2378 RepID=UPI0003885BC3|nr:hypothetical protein [Sporomusa ovata]EQB25563.1 hypothetical protein SOV_4c02260 [Sporomusa ovata DSM 2662]